MPGIKPGMTNEALPFNVMAGLVPAIHVFNCCKAAKTWMPGKKPGHDVLFSQSTGHLGSKSPLPRTGVLLSY